MANVTMDDLNAQLLRGGFYYQTTNDAAAGRWVITVEAPGTGPLPVTSADNPADRQQATFDQVTVKNFFLDLNSRPDPIFGVIYPDAMPSDDEFMARYGKLPLQRDFESPPPRTDVTYDDLRVVMFQAGYQLEFHSSPDPATGKLAVDAIPINDPSGAKATFYSSAPAPDDPANATFPPESVRQLFDTLTVTPPPDFALKYPYAVEGFVWQAARAGRPLTVSSTDPLPDWSGRANAPPDGARDGGPPAERLPAEPEDPMAGQQRDQQDEQLRQDEQRRQQEEQQREQQRQTEERQRQQESDRGRIR